MSQVILDSAQVMPLVRQRISTGMTEHARMSLTQVGALADAPDQVVDDALASELDPVFGDEGV